jgi:hypothetical protein
MPDTNQKGKAHRHPRPMPEYRFLPARARQWDQVYRSPSVPDVEFILPDNNTFGLLDLRDLVDSIGNEGEE